MDYTIEELVQLVTYHQDRYYNDQPEISDSEFDALWDELRQRAPEHPVFDRVGTDADEAFTKRPHVIPMNSQEKAANPEQFLKWADRVRHSSYIVQYKLDGASLELQYTNGRLRYGVTRGDGRIGDDITHNVIRMQGVPRRLPETFSGAVRGEVVMEHDIHQRYYPDKANCRNAANGVMRRKDGVGSEYLKVLCYDAIGSSEDQRFSREELKLQWLQSVGFEPVPYRTFSSPEEVIHYRDLVIEKRSDLEYDIDGLVVKGPDVDIEDMRRARPQKQIAFKFSAEEALTVLRDVEWSESGHLYTPVGIVDPVRLAGTTVQRASLVHPELIQSMGLQIGSEVIITKRGDIIPKIERRVRDTDETRPIAPPTNCGTCGTAVINEGKRVYCPNPTCPRRAFHRLQKWITVLDIRDFGDVLLGKLFDNQLVREIADLYQLNLETLTQFDGVGEVSASKALKNLRAVNPVPLARFIAGFDIGGIAELKIQKIIDAGFGTLDHIKDASPEELIHAEGIAAITAETIQSGLQAVYPQMERLLNTGEIRIQVPKDETASDSDRADQPLAGKSFCFTGTLESLKRSEAEQLVRSAGGEIRTSVSGELSFLVTNDPDSGSSKARRARRLGLSVISETDFLKMLEKKSPEIIAPEIKP